MKTNAKCFGISSDPKEKQAVDHLGSRKFWPSLPKPWTELSVQPKDEGGNDQQAASEI